MDQNPTAGIQTVDKSSPGGMSSQLFGSNFKKDNLERRVQELMKESTEFHELKKCRH